MLKVMNRIDVSKTYPGCAIKTTDDGYLLTPRLEQSTLPRLQLVVDQTAYLGTNGQLLNGAFPVAMSSEQAKYLIADLKFALKGNPEAILFLRAIPTKGKKQSYKVVRPSQAKEFLLRTNYNRTSDLHTGADRKYAKQHGAMAFSSHDTTDDCGQDFWQLPITMLSLGTIQRFDQDWAARVQAAINEHADHHPEDVDLIEFHSDLLEHPEDEDADMCTLPQDDPDNDPEDTPSSVPSQEHPNRRRPDHHLPTHH